MIIMYDYFVEFGANFMAHIIEHKSYHFLPCCDIKQGNT